MKTIIAGSRYITKERFDLVMDSADVKSFLERTDEVVSGGARGVDTFGERWAREHKIPVTRFPADWDTHGRRAGYLRNTEMAHYADALLAIWDGQSRGTTHMIEIARGRRLPVLVVQVGDQRHLEEPIPF